MAGKRQLKNGSWEYQFQRKGLLERTYRTFIKESDGDRYAEQIESLLDKGVVPSELLQQRMSTLGAMLDLYEILERLAPSAVSLMPSLHNTIGDVKISHLNNEWVDDWVTIMKRTLAPSTLKKRVELLARCVDWAMRKDMVALTQNPLRLLPRGYASDGKDRQRDRRLSADGAEEGAIRKVLISADEHLMFDMALETAMRMREMYTLTKDQVDLKKDTIFLDRTKNGDRRQVPISSVLKRLLEAHLPTVDERLFPWWDGSLSQVYLDNLSTKLSQRFARRFDKAGCGDLHFHDLRHEATSRIYERTTLTDLEVASITGHKDPRMLKRYANLRGSNLAAKLW